jgi:Pyruvate/2-oxoacid:ferredoxin oxidoreductase delta subunit
LGKWGKTLDQSKDWTKEHLEKHYIGRMKAVTIPVNVSFSGKQRILDLSELEDILRNAKTISQNECDCRKKMGHCIEPMDGCLTLDKEAEDDIKNNRGKEITIEEALQAMKRTHDAGLVHMAYVYEGKEKPWVICSCCRCCCHSLSAALRFGYEGHVIFSQMIALQDNELCDECGICADRCQFQARFMENGEFHYISEKCGGCGLCLSECPNEAITMIKREEITVKEGVK